VNSKSKKIIMDRCPLFQHKCGNSNVVVTHPKLDLERKHKNSSTISLPIFFIKLFNVEKKY
jgi:hypothetical protein